MWVCLNKGQIIPGITDGHSLYLHFFFLNEFTKTFLCIAEEERNETFINECGQR